eukprot:TRINITY_DN24081_c0_g1_i6.p1 TRINITY_DN24081_c0_g1~~TRINITY_DN24081_c0_g1_i6.p1  ORF type:complete len:370 (+),score=11.61 TRINITY_DN24081_c0_g1_i6:82-1110(+)
MWAYLLLLFTFTHCQKPEICNSLSSFIQAPPRIHGKVQKEAALPAKLWWNVPRKYHYDIMKQFMTERQITLDKTHVLQNNAPVNEPVILPQVAQCQVFISHKYKLIYVKNAKTGGSSLVNNFGRTCNRWNDTTTNRECISGAFRKPGDPLQEIPNQEFAEKIWQEYFVFTGIRNPFSRAASAYSYLLGRRQEFNTHQLDGCQNPQFSDYCKAPYVIGMQTEQNECIDNKMHDYLHVESESQCVRTPDGKLVVDFILSMEHLQDDYENLMEVLVQREGMNATQKQYFRRLHSIKVPHKNAVSEQKSYAEKLYEDCGQECITNTVKYYKNDFQTFGYETCQDFI